MTQALPRSYPYGNSTITGVNGNTVTTNPSGAFSPQNYGYSSQNYGYSSQTVTATGTVAMLKQPQSIAYITLKSGDLGLYFIGTGAVGGTGPEIIAEFKPEPDITSYEYMRINQLQMMVMVAAGDATLASKIDTIEYLRRHNLERHFTFTAA